VSAHASPRKAGLRERKKLRTRQTISRVALELFERNGYQATTLAEIAERAEISPSTLYAYFPTKEDILLHPLAAVTAAAKQHLLEQPAEPVVDALQAWVVSMPSLFDGDTTSIRRRRTLIEGDPSLQMLERMHLVRLEDVLAEAFARDLRETAGDLRSRLMASVTVQGLRAIWFWWYKRHAEGELDVREPFALDATYLPRLVRAAEIAIEELPMPDEHLRDSEPASA
jgi:AcrR family transcriptional regulator